jgi:hypothetical protein
MPEGRRRPWLALAILVLLGVAVYFPALRTPFLLDDYLQASMIEGTFPAKRGPFDLYDFVNDADRASLTERGMLPWWSHPELKIRFFRPLSSALRWADHRLLGESPISLHLHSFAWWLAAVLAARALFRRALAPRAATIATLVFALAPCHTLPLTWLANREALLSLAFGTFGLLAYARFREQRGHRDGALAALLFTLAVLSGEYALCFAGYILAIELGLRGEPLFRRGLGVLPFAVPAAGYLLVRARLGYGTLGSGFYTDPFRETLPFLHALPRRLATLLVDGWFALDDETLTSETPGWALALLVLCAAPLLFVPLRRAFVMLDDERRRRASWMLLGSFFSLLPVLAVVPSPRLLGVSVLGVATAVGLLLDHAWFPAAGVPLDRRPAAQLTGFVALLLGFSHLVHGPGTSWLMARRLQRTAVSFASHVAALRGRVPAPENSEVVVIRAIAGAFFLPFALDERGRLPFRFRILAQAGHALVLRHDARTFDIIVPPEQSLFPTGPGQLFRSMDAPLAVGDVLTVPGVRATILDVGRRGPRSARFELDRELESPTITWITEDRDGLPITEPPAPGFGKPFDP